VASTLFLKNIDLFDIGFVDIPFGAIFLRFDATSGEGAGYG
jgi:hypothetical protein